MFFAEIFGDYFWNEIKFRKSVLGIGFLVSFFLRVIEGRLRSSWGRSRLGFYWWFYFLFFSK